MAEWTDGRERSKGYRGTALDLAIEKYFNDRNQEERLGLQWDNEAMRRDLDKPEQGWKAPAAGV